MDFNQLFDISGVNIGVGGTVLVLLLAIWELVWKGLGLWKAAQNRQTAWFVAILIFNTLGILPILYLYVFSPKANA
jgi:hypothetical protein